MLTPILLTGATGYIGGRLLRRLENDGRRVRCLARRPERVQTSSSLTEVVAGDCLDEASLDRAMCGVSEAYYLVHSMAESGDYSRLDHQAAETFGGAARRAGVKRIIYLGGLADDLASLSTHLKSRADTGVMLRASGVPVIEFRSSVVIGAGSVSFEMIRALVERLPAMVCPRWVSTLTQPIAIDDVVAYLAAALDLPGGEGGIFEIGGPEVVSYGEMMREYARVRGLRRLLLPVPVLTPRLSGLWLRLVAPAQARIGRALIESLRNTTVVRSTHARTQFPGIQPMSLGAAFVNAAAEGAAAHLKRDTRMLAVNVPPADAFAPIRRIGGTAGWYSSHLLWAARGWIDKLIGGVGMDRGRKDPELCGVGDVIDGWTVEAFVPDRLLRLRSDWKLPGRGWLEFEVTPIDGGRASQIRQTATFDARGLLGRAYWLAVLPFHGLVFSGLLRAIGRRAESRHAGPRASVFVFRSVIRAQANDLFLWHERPQALLDLIPGRLMSVEERVGGIRDGDRVTLAVGVWPFRVRWEARHFGFVAGRQFCDEQVRGPFSRWRHTHRFEPIGTDQSLYEDRVEYALPGGPTINRFAAPLVRRMLARSFATRHRIVQEKVASTAAPAARCLP